MQWTPSGRQIKKFGAFWAIYQKLSKLPWKSPWGEERVPFDEISIRLCSRQQIQDGGTDIAAEYPEHAFPPGKVSNGKQDYLLKIPLIIIPGNFQVEHPENVCSINIPTGISGISW